MTSPSRPIDTTAVLLPRAASQSASSSTVGREAICTKTARVTSSPASSRYRPSAGVPTPIVKTATAVVNQDVSRCPHALLHPRVHGRLGAAGHPRHTASSCSTAPGRPPRTRYRVGVYPSSSLQSCCINEVVLSGLDLVQSIIRLMTSPPTGIPRLPHERLFNTSTERGSTGSLTDSRDIAGKLVVLPAKYWSAGMQDERGAVTFHNSMSNTRRDRSGKDRDGGTHATDGLGHRQDRLVRRAGARHLVCPQANRDEIGSRETRYGGQGANTDAAPAK